MRDASFALLALLYSLLIFLLSYVLRVTWNYLKYDKNQIGADVKMFVFFIHVTLLPAGKFTFQVSLELSLLFINVLVLVKKKIVGSRNALNMNNLFITFLKL